SSPISTTNTPLLCPSPSTQVEKQGAGISVGNGGGEGGGGWKRTRDWPISHTSTTSLDTVSALQPPLKRIQMTPASALVPATSSTPFQTPYQHIKIPVSQSQSIPQTNADWSLSPTSLSSSVISHL